VAKTMSVQRFGGTRDLFQTIFFYRNIFQIFCFAEMKIIFKPKNIKPTDEK